MDIDRKRVIRSFEDYVADYDTSDIRNRLKIEHTFRVAQLSERIAQSLGLNASQVSLAWMLGILHDIGRFEQLRRYGTFIDLKSIDHAELGADILFGDGTIASFADVVSGDDMVTIAETAIRLHNKFMLPDDLDGDTKMFSNILRDADKCDIFRVITEPPFDERNQLISKSRDAAKDVVMQYVHAHRCVPRKEVNTAFEGLISQCCMAFELVYPESRKIVIEQGYLDILLSIDLQLGPKEQMEELKAELGKALVKQ